MRRKELVPLLTYNASKIEFVYNCQLLGLYNEMPIPYAYLSSGSRTITFHIHANTFLAS